MLHTELLTRLRERIRAQLSHFGVQSETMAETILLRDECYVGRRFSADGWNVEWDAERASLEFYNRSNKLVEQMNFDPEREWRREQAA